MPVFSCPSDGRLSTSQPIPGSSSRQVAGSSYLGVSGVTQEDRKGVIFADSRVGINSIPDGTSNTVMLGERPPSHDFNIGWWYGGIGLDGSGVGDSYLSITHINKNYSGCPVGPYSFSPSAISNPCSFFSFLEYTSWGSAFSDGGWLDPISLLLNSRRVTECNGDTQWQRNDSFVSVDWIVATRAANVLIIRSLLIATSRKQRSCDASAMVTVNRYAAWFKRESDQGNTLWNQVTARKWFESSTICSPSFITHRHMIARYSAEATE